MNKKRIAIAFIILSFSFAALSSGNPLETRRTVGSLWNSDQLIAYFDFTTTNARPTSLIFPYGYKLEITVAPNKAQVIHLSDRFGNLLSSETIKVDEQKPIPFRYQICGKIARRIDSTAQPIVLACK